MRTKVKAPDMRMVIVYPDGRRKRIVPLPHAIAWTVARAVAWSTHFEVSLHGRFGYAEFNGEGTGQVTWHGGDIHCKTPFDFNTIICINRPAQPPARPPVPPRSRGFFRFPTSTIRQLRINYIDLTNGCVYATMGTVLKVPIRNRRRAMTTKTKKPCPVSRDQFNQHAAPMKVVVGNQAVGIAEPRQFSSGSMGWYYGGKMQVEIDGVLCTVQVGVNLTLVGSKEAQ